MFDLGIGETKRKLRNLLDMMAWKKGMYEDQHMEERERLFQDSKQADRAFSLLKESRILDHFYQMESLRIRYSEYAEKNKTEFSFEELFDEGWPDRRNQDKVCPKGESEKAYPEDRRL